MAKNKAQLFLNIGSQLIDGETVTFGHKIPSGDFTPISLTAVTSSPSTYEFLIGATLTETAQNYYSALSDYSDQIVPISNVGSAITVEVVNSEEYFIRTNDYATIPFSYTSSYRERLYYEFQDIDGFDKRVSILDDEYTGSPYEVCGTNNPFIIEYPEKDIFDPIKSSGCKLEFLYKGDESFVRDMFTSDINRFRVVLKDLSTNSIDWSGFLNSELYEEDYSQDGETNGIVYQMTGNDGFANLERYTLTDDHQDTLTLYSIFKICSPILGLDIEYIDTFSRTVLDQLGENNIYCNSDIDLISRYENGANGEGGAYGVFGNVYLNKTNYLDEDGEYLTLRTVIEEVLRPYRLHAVKIGSSIRIQSANTRFNTGSDIVYDTYDVQEDSYTASYTPISNNLVNIDKDKYYQTGQTLTSIPKVNEQVVAIDNYIEESIFPNELDSGDNFQDFFGEDLSAGDDYGWNGLKYDTHADYNIRSQTVTNKAIPTKINPSILHKVSTDSRYTIIKRDFDYINSGDIVNEIGDISFYSKQKIPASIPSGETNMKLSVDALFQNNFDDYMKQNTAGTGVLIFGVELQCYIKYGNKYLTLDRTKIFSHDPNETSPTGEVSDIYSFDNLRWGDTPTTVPLYFGVHQDGNGNPPVDKVNGNWLTLFNYNYPEFWDTDFKYLELAKQDSFLTLPTVYNSNTDSGVDNIPSYVEIGIGNRVGQSRAFYWSDTDSVNKYSARAILFQPNTFYDYIAIGNVSLEIEYESDSEKIEFVRQTDDSWKESGSKVELMHGTSCLYNYGIYNGNPLVERGSMSVFEDGYVNSYIPINSIEVEKIKTDTIYDGAFIHSKGNSGLIEDLLMDSLMANRGEVLQQLSLSLEGRFVNQMTTISMPDLGGKFIFTGGEVDMYSRSITGTWKEIKPD